MLYDTKVVTAGNIKEIRTYSKQRLKGTTLASLGQVRARTSSKKGTTKPRRDNIKRTKDKIRYILHANTATTRPIFVTLTYRENITSRDTAVADVTRFLRSLRVIYPGIAYVYVLERQKRGAFHAHMVIFNVSFIPFQALESIWTFGYTNVKRLQDETHIANYLSKYISKDETYAVGKRRYSRSKNLLLEQYEWGKGLLADLRHWRLDVERTYGTMHGTYKIAIYKYENSG